ncbi:MAG: cysteine synthase A [Lentisphaeria bacterium]|nr:cysteine synthase A [Lentisphaeria bacterium]
MTKIHSDILSTIGSTPLVRINKLNSTKAEIVAKLESFNPGASAKDRPALAMIEAAEKSGLLKPGAMIIEPTSGNTGIGLAVAAAVKGYKLCLTMPDTMSVERRKLLAAYGAEIVLTPGAEGMTGAIAKAEELKLANPGAFIPQQFKNQDNAAAHENSTGPEILRDTEGEIAALVAGVGTGGTITGTGRFLKKHVPGMLIAAVEPTESPILSGGTPAPHKLQGIGANFIPDVLDVKLLDRIITVSAEDAARTAREAASKEGILIGISGGAALWGALELARSGEFDGKRIVVILPDSGERYLSTWLFEQ